MPDQTRDLIIESKSNTNSTRGFAIEKLVERPVHRHGVFAIPVRSLTLHVALVGAALLGLCFSVPATAETPNNWGGLVLVPAKSVDYLYLRPQADFRPYTAIVLDPPEVSFRKGWQKNMNKSRPGLKRVSDAEVRRVIDQAQGKLRSTFERSFQQSGLQIVPAPAGNALRVFVGIANVAVEAPEMRGRASSYSNSAGRAVLVVEVRDSLSGELLGRAVDHGYAGDSLTGATWRSSISNWADFQHLFDEWGAISSKGLGRLIASSPQATPQLNGGNR
jgi:hypothetical protein